MKRKNGFKLVLLAALLLVGSSFVIFALPILRFIGINIGNGFDVNFSGPGNSFLGAIMIDRMQDLDPPYQSVKMGGTTKICHTQLIGLYFNSQRGNRMWPLDAESLAELRRISSTYNAMAMDGGFFTNCEDSNSGSIYGQIKHRWGGSRSGHMVAGTKFNYVENKTKDGFADSLQVFDVSQGITILGMMRDRQGGIGIVGGPSGLSGLNNLITFINSGGSILSGFSYTNEQIVGTNTGGRWFTDPSFSLGGTNMLRDIFVRGSVGLSNSYDDDQSTNIGTTTQSDALLYSLSDVNISTLINGAREKASSLCRDKWNKYNTYDRIWCKDDGIDLDIDLSDNNIYGKRTIIVKNGNVTLRNSMKGTDNPFELFIDKGVLYLENPISIDPMKLEAFSGDGYPEAGADGFHSDFLKGVFIINGLFLGSGYTSTGGINSGNIHAFKHKLTIHGKITSLNSPSPTVKRKQQVSDLLGSSFSGYINLRYMFNRRCSYGGSGSDGTVCNGVGDIVTKPIVIIDDLDTSMTYRLLEN